MLKLICLLLISVTVCDAVEYCIRTDLRVIYCSGYCCGYLNDECCTTLLSTYQIIGIVVGCIVLLSIIVTCVMCICASQKRPGRVVQPFQPTGTVVYSNSSGTQPPPYMYNAPRGPVPNQGAGPYHGAAPYQGAGPYPGAGPKPGPSPIPGYPTSAYPPPAYPPPAYPPQPTPNQPAVNQPQHPPPAPVSASTPAAVPPTTSPTAPPAGPPTPPAGSDPAFPPGAGPGATN